MVHPRVIRWAGSAALGVAALAWQVGGDADAGWWWWLAPLLAVPVTGGISAGLLGMGAAALASLIAPAAPPAVAATTVVTAIAARWMATGRGPCVPLVLAIAALGVPGDAWRGVAGCVALALALPAARLLLAPRDQPPRGLNTLLNTALGHGAFILLCLLPPVLLPVVLASGRHRRRVVAALLHMGSRVLLAAAPTACWRWCVVADAPAGPWVLAGNHESVLDIPACLALPGRSRVLLAKAWVFRTPLLGFIARLGGMIPLALLAAGRLAADAVPPTADLVVFPEGTRSRVTRHVGRFRSGAVQAARDLARPVMLAVQIDTGRVLAAGSPWIRPGRLLTVVRLSGPLPDARPAAAAEIRRQVLEIIALERRPWHVCDILGRLEDLAQHGPVARWRWCGQQLGGWWRAADVIAARLQDDGRVEVSGRADGLVLALRQRLPALGGGREVVRIVVDGSPPSAVPSAALLVVPSATAPAWAAATGWDVVAVPRCPLVLLAPSADAGKA